MPMTSCNLKFLNASLMMMTSTSYCCYSGLSLFLFI
jgi:hypothetical protein